MLSCLSGDIDTQAIQNLANSDIIMKLYQSKDYQSLTDKFCDFFLHFSKFNYVQLPDELYFAISRIVTDFLFIMTRPDYVIPQSNLAILLGLNPVISNVIALSVCKSSDPQIRMLQVCPGNFLKTLILHSPRNSVKLDSSLLFNIDSTIASIWYFNQYLATGSLSNQISYNNLREEVKNIDDRLNLADQRITHSYFMSTYIDNKSHRKLKTKLNQIVRSRLHDIHIKNKPNGKTIAIITGKWAACSSVYRCYAKAVREMAKTFSLELVHLGELRDDLDTSLFEKIRTVSFKDGKINVDEISDNNFQGVFYPDVGMTIESIYITNLRLAPVQIMGYGHPASTFGSQIDYLIGGGDLELLEDAEKNYTERLVLIPGNGQPTSYPVHLNINKSKNEKQVEKSNILIINCPWSQDKTTYPLLCCLREIKDRSNKKILFRFFPNEGILRFNFTIPYIQDIREVLGESSEVRLVFKQDYLDCMVEGDLTLDSHPFTGYNTIIDSLLAGKPIISLEGRQAFERVGAALLRRVGLGELVANSIEEYITKALHLINNLNYRREVTQQILKLDLQRTLFDQDNGGAFAKAFRYLIENHEFLRSDGSKKPIIITNSD